MALSAREWRHHVLLSLIITTLPLLIYPHTVGLGFKVHIVWYTVVEIIYFYAIFRLLNPGKGGSVAVHSTLFSLGGRLVLSTVFMLLLAIVGPVGFAAAFKDAFAAYKPALLLFSLVSPVIYNSVFKMMFTPAQTAGPLIMQSRSSVSRQPESSIVPPEPVIHTAQPAMESKPIGEYFDRSFEEAVRHIGGYSGVITVLLIDREGLPVADWSRGDDDRDAWSALVIKMIAEIEQTISRVESPQLKTFEFESAGRRFSILRVNDMWLMAMVDAACDQMEKIRLQQAAEMISRRMDEKYSKVEIKETEREYAGSTM